MAGLPSLSALTLRLLFCSALLLAAGPTSPGLAGTEQRGVPLPPPRRPKQRAPHRGPPHRKGASLLPRRSCGGVKARAALLSRANRVAPLFASVCRRRWGSGSSPSSPCSTTPPTARPPATSSTPLTSLSRPPRPPRGKAPRLGRGGGRRLSSRRRGPLPWGRSSATREYSPFPRVPMTDVPRSYTLGRFVLS